MFRRNKPEIASKQNAALNGAGRKGAVPSIIAQGMHLLGNIVSDGVIDFDGTIDGNIRCASLNVRKNGVVNGEITADEVYVYGKVKGLIRARSVSLFASCNIEGIVMHESIAMEDGAFLDGKLKRTDKIPGVGPDAPDDDDDGSPAEPVRMLENIRLIR